MSTIENKIHIGNEWSKGFYRTYRKGVRYKVRIKIKANDSYFRVIFGFFDYKEDKLLFEEAACNNLRLAKSIEGLRQIEADEAIDEMLQE